MGMEFLLEVMKNVLRLTVATAAQLCGCPKNH